MPPRCACWGDGSYRLAAVKTIEPASRAIGAGQHLDHRRFAGAVLPISAMTSPGSTSSEAAGRARPA
jgi:hypothetical protein